MTNFINAIAPYVGAITSSTIASISPENVIIAPLLGTAIESNLEILGNEIQNRILSKKENERVAECFGYAIKKISERLEKGDKLRNDDFFIAEYDDSSSCDKLLESAFINSRNEIEKKKLKYISNLIGNILFTNHTFERCLHFQKIIEKISWRQFCLIALVAKKIELSLEESLKTGRATRKEEIDYRMDVFELVEYNVIHGPYSMTKTTINPLSEYKLGWIGEQLFALMELSNIDIQELRDYI